MDIADLPKLSAVALADLYGTMSQQFKAEVAREMQRRLRMLPEKEEIEACLSYVQGVILRREQKGYHHNVELDVLHDLLTDVLEHLYPEP